MTSAAQVERQVEAIRARGHRPAVIVGLLSMYTASGEAVPSRGLVRAVQALGLSESSTRTALSRTQAEGKVVRERDGRRTSYLLAPATRAGSEAERDRMLATAAPAEQPLSLVAFSIPEAQRDLRHELRAQLSAAGFVSLFDGLWAATRDRAGHARKLLSDLGVESGCVFRAEVDAPEAAPFRIAGPEVARHRTRLAEFLELYGPLRGARLDAAQAYQVRSGLSRDWFALVDPHPALPPSLLADWPIDEVRDTVRELWAATAEPGGRHFGELTAD
ncbi:hypothetical protein [Streptodolium elevatio]